MEVELFVDVVNKKHDALQEVNKLLLRRLRTAQSSAPVRQVSLSLSSVQSQTDSSSVVVVSEPVRSVR